MRRLALVTGANRGIGRAIVIALARQGFDVAFVDLQHDAETDRTLALAQAADARASFIPGNIADLAQHETILDQAYAFAGPLHALVNNAGISVAVRGDVLNVTPDDFDRVMSVNLRGTFFLTQAAARRMLLDPRLAEPRSITTVTSANAFLVAPDRAAYCFSKAALSMMSKVFAVRLAEAGIHCFEVRPGIIRTDMTRVAADRYDRLIAEGLLPMPRWGEPDDVGKATAALANGQFSYMTGEALHLDGGLHIHRL